MKTNLDTFFKMDEEVEKTGVWFNISDTVGFLIKPFRPSNPNVKRAMASYFKPYARQIEMGTMDPRDEREVMAKVFVNSSLVDWKGVEIDGKLTPFSKDVAVQFLTGLEPLFETLMTHAQDFKNYKQEEEDREELGNS